MTERMKTGNTLLDAWFDAMAPSMRTDALPAAASWERLFFGNLPGAADGGFTHGSDVGAQFAERWGDVAQRTFGVVTALGSKANAGDPLGDALEKSFGVLSDVGIVAAEGPALLAEAAKAASALLAAREAYRAVMLATWQRAFGEVTAEATRRASAGEPVVTPAQWSSLSNAVADRVFVEAFHSQAYIDAQHRLSSALADSRLAEMKLVELFARLGHVPTQRALDAVGGELNDLRRRVRELERANRSASSKRRKKAEAADER